MLAENAILAHANVGQISPYHTFTHDDILAVQHNILRATQYRLPADFVTCMLYENKPIKFIS